MVDFTVSEKIRAQLGGNKFVACTGAKDFVTRGFDLQFRLPKAKKDKINLVKIELVNDVYSMSFYNFKPSKFLLEKVRVVEGVSVESLVEVFEAVTGYKTKI